MYIDYPYEGGPWSGQRTNCPSCQAPFVISVEDEPGTGNPLFTALRHNSLVSVFSGWMFGLMVTASVLIVFFGVYTLGWTTGDPVFRLLGLLMRKILRSIGM